MIKKFNEYAETPVTLHYNGSCWEMKITGSLVGEVPRPRGMRDAEYKSLAINALKKTYPTNYSLKGLGVEQQPGKNSDAVDDMIDKYKRWK